MFPARIPIVSVPPSGLINTYSLAFDGSNDYVDVGATFQTTLDGAFTVSAWIKLNDGQPSVPESIVGSSSTGDEDKFRVRVDTDGKIRLVYKSNAAGSSMDDASTSAVFANGATDWTHIAATFTESGGTVTGGLYVNGVSEAGSFSGTAAMADFVTSNNLYIGALNEASGISEYFDGNIDEVGIWNTALSAGSISNIYNNGVPTDLLADSNSANLQGWWRMGDGVLDYFNLIADQVNPTLGSELLNNGDFATGDLTGWTVADAWSGSDDDGVIYQDGGVRFRSAGDSIAIQQEILTSGKLYKVVYECTSYTSGNWYTRGGNVYVRPNSGAGTHTNYLLSDGADFMINRDTGGITHDFILDNISVKEVLGNPGLMTNMASDDIVKDTP